MIFTQLEQEKTSYNKKEIISLIICGITIVGLLICSLPDKGPDIIRRQLSERGINAENILFTRTENKWQHIYKSSVPVDIGSGNLVEYWILVNASFSTINTIWVVYPYPEREWPEPITLNIIFSPDEYRVLKEKAGNMPIDVYIKNSILGEEN